MCNPSKKTIKKLMRMLESACIKDETFDMGKGAATGCQGIYFQKSY